MPYGLFRWGKGTFAPDSAGKIGKSDPVAGKKHGAAHAAVFRNGDGAGIEVISVFVFLKSRNVGVSADQHIAGGEGGTVGRAETVAVRQEKRRPPSVNQAYSAMTGKGSII